MITLSDILRSINARIETLGYNVQSHDVAKGFTRPVFYTQLDNIEFKGEVSQRVTSCTARITFFPTDRYEYRLEVLNVMSSLTDTFDLKLKVKDRLLNIEQIQFDIVDGVLHGWFDLEFSSARDVEWGDDPTKPFEYMEHLDVELKLKGDD